MTNLRELIARAAGDCLGSYVGPDRDMDESLADAILAALDNAGLMVVAKTQERNVCVKCGKPFAWNHGFVWLDNATRMHRDCYNPTTAKRWKK
jgi:hypothetical protein